MSYNGSGTFLINTAGQPVVSGTVISSTAFNALTADLATGLSTAITKDGQTTVTANIPMGTYKFTGLGAGTAATDSANLSQVQSTVTKLLASVSGADTITAVGSPTLGAYAAGQMFYFVAASANTGAVTINIDSLGAKSITRDGTTALAAGDIQSGEVCVIVYDGTQFQLVNGASQSASIVTENLTVNKATVLNESGGDNDTRIEGDTDANLFFADASTDRIGIGTSSPSTKLHVVGGAATEIRVVTSGDLTTTGASFLRFGGSNSGTSGYLGYGGTGNTYDIYNGLNGPLEFYTNASKKMVLDASGNLGLGVTPSAWWSSFKALQVGTYAGIASGSGVSNYFNNAFFDGTNFKYLNTATAAWYQQDGNEHKWYTAPSGTAGNTISFTQAMTLDASGRLGIGTTSPGYKLETAGTQNNNDIVITNTTTSSSLRMQSVDAYGAVIVTGNYPLMFGTNNGEKARITAGGNFGVNTTNPQQKIHITGNDQTNVRMRWENNGTGGRNYEIVGGLNAANNSSFSVYDATAAANRLEITSTGTFIVPQVYNDTTANAANMQVDSAGVFRRSTSSLKYKTDVQDATHGLAEVLALRPVTYKGKTDGDKVFGGLIAEEVHDAGLTEFVVYDNEGNPDALAYGNMVSVLVKAIQELSAKVAALEAK